MAKSIVAQVVELNNMSMEGLREKWEALFETKPPDNPNRRQLVAKLAYRLQELTFGGLSKDAREKLEKIAEFDLPPVAGKKLARPANKPIPGTRYVREWQGMRIEVTALDSGFEYEGKSYRSLSAIATEVTGTKWNGLEFFGLRSKKKGTKNAKQAS